MHTLHGTWELVRAETNGDHSPQMLALRIELELTEDTYVVRFGGDVADRGTYTLPPPTDASGHPVMLIHGTEGPNAGRTIPGIFQHVGDRLRICYGLGGTLPADFATAPGTPLYLATYRRKPV